MGILNRLGINRPRRARTDGTDSTEPDADRTDTPGTNPGPDRRAGGGPALDRTDGSRRRTASVTPSSPTSPSEATEVTENDLIDREVPWGIRIAGGWSWRLIVIVIMVAGIGWLLRYLSEVTIPIAVAILLAALISPVANFFNRHRFPRPLSALLSMIIGVVLVAGTVTLIGTQIAGQAQGMGARVADGFGQLTSWLANGPLHVPRQFLQIDRLTAQIRDFLNSSSSTIARYAAGVGTGIGHFLAGLAITLFATFYFLYDGRGIWAFLTKFAPIRARKQIDAAAKIGWTSLVHYVRATILVAFADAIGVLIVALVLRVPGAAALAALVFLGAFVPLVGAFVSGFVAVFVALVMLGWVQALIMLAGIIAVMQVEGHILQPFLLGRAVRLHPLAVLLGIAIGVIVGGIVGALMSIPLLAFAKTFIQSLASHEEPPVAAEPTVIDSE